MFDALNSQFVLWTVLQMPNIYVRTMVNKFLECLFSSTLVILETEMAGDENQYRF